jgi:NADP-dependent aldehyde dehydrogenase
VQLHGKNLIDGQATAQGGKTFQGVDPATRKPLETDFHEANESEINAAALAAQKYFQQQTHPDAGQIATFLECIGTEIEALGDDLIQRAKSESGLPEARLTGERGRTVNQLKLFAEVVREGSWADARVDRALPDRKPLARPDLRRKLSPLGPIAVFGASNFPLAFSVAGGDTASALAAGNPVVVKAHPAHPGTSEMVGRAILSAAQKTHMPPGVFSLLHGVSPEMSLSLVRHPAIAAVGFTGSLKAGRALFDAAAARPNPIPVFAEMGSTNPVFLLPGALKQNPALAEGFVQSVSMGVGQFCTNPGLVFGMVSPELEAFTGKAGEFASRAAPGTMLNAGICERFHAGAQVLTGTKRVRLVAQSQAAVSTGQAGAMVFATDAATFQKEKSLHEELFGPSTLIVACGSAQELEAIAREMPGQLTATIQGTEADLEAHRGLVAILSQKVGRLLFNGFPTGVEVSHAMHHGGPYPATTDSRFTSVGTAAIQRFARPICYQNFPDSSLPPELQRTNPHKIWRLLDGQWTQDPG